MNWEKVAMLVSLFAGSALVGYGLSLIYPPAVYLWAGLVLIYLGRPD